MIPGKIGIIGAGAVGSILAAHLSKTGHEVYIVDLKREIIDAINESGLHIGGAMELQSHVTKALTSIAELDGLDLSYVFLCLKAYIMPGILNDLGRLDNNGTSFVSFQNGLDILELLAAQLRKDNLFRVAVNYAGNVTKPAHVTAAFFHPPNYIGCLEGSSVATIERAKEISSFLTEAGLETEYTPKIKKMVWQKAILNSALMPTSVLTRLLMEQIMSIPETRAVVESNLLECMEVAGAEGYVFDDNFKDKAMQYLSTAGAHKTSMLVDFEAGSPIEIDFLNGKIQEYADKHGISCETNRLMLSLVKGLLHYRDNLKDEGRKKNK